MGALTYPLRALVGHDQDRAAIEPRVTPEATFAALFACVVVAALAVPILPDEAYYVAWSQRPALGYLDHPPVVALLASASRLLAGSASVARIGSLLTTLLAFAATVHLGRSAGLDDRRVLATATLLRFGTPIGLGVSFLVTPDGPMFAAWALALAEACRALRGDRRRWLSAGVAVGLGLWCKYTTALLGPVFLWGMIRSDLAFLGLVALQFWLLATWAPLLPNREVLIGIVAFGALIALFRRATPRTIGLILVAASLVPAVAGPFPMPPRWRAVSFAAHAAVLLTPWLLLRARLVPETGPIVLACFVCFTSFWGRLGQTAFMPSNEPLAEPVVTAAFRGEPERIRSGAFFFTQPCAGWPLIAGSKERERGLVVFPAEGGPSVAGMRFMASDNYAPDCPTDSIYVANFLEAKLYRLHRDETRPRGELGTLHLEPLPHRCPVRGPWWLILDRGARHLYILDEQNEIAVADLDSDECHLVATGEKLWDFVIDDDRGELVLGDAGRVRVLRKSDGAELDRIDLPGRWRGVVPAAHKTKVALAADGTVYAAYFNAGTVSKIRRDPLRIEASTTLERGVRLLLWDEARRALYVGNRSSGALDALDGETLRVRGHVHVGRRMRTFSLTPDGRALLLGSVVGAVRVDLDRLVQPGR